MMNSAALKFYETLRRDGMRKGVVSEMQFRAYLYRFLDYHRYEDKLDASFVQHHTSRYR